MSRESELIVSVSGIRGVVGESLTPEVATAFALALATTAGRGLVVVSRDGRPSGDALRHAVTAGLLSGGCDVTDLGIAPTPTCGLAVRDLGAVGGIQITASHNPAPWNGLKLFAADGRVLSAGAGQAILEKFQAKTFTRARWDGQGREAKRPYTLTNHLARVVTLVDTVCIQRRSLHVFLDANGGAGGPLGKQLLKALHVSPICHAWEADGQFLHAPEPVAANLKEICPMVSQNGADIGFVLDPDADRLALIDETGRYIGEELTLALAVRFRLAHEPGPIVVNMSTSRVCEDIARNFGCVCHRSAVGEANVVDQMRAVGAVIGGEGNGGVIDPRVGWVRDPFIGMGLILNLMAETGKKLSELVAELPAYHIVKDKYTVKREGLPQLYSALEAQWPEAKPNLVDGLRLDWEDRWVHIRPSNTEPIVRVIAEAPQQAQAETLCRRVGDRLRAEQHTE
jgi:phosphomannomutase